MKYFISIFKSLIRIEDVSMFGSCDTTELAERHLKQNPEPENHGLVDDPSRKELLS
jgi:hypothetical protein